MEYTEGEKRRKENKTKERKQHERTWAKIRRTRKGILKGIGSQQDEEHEQTEATKTQ